MSIRAVKKVVPSKPTLEGAGVKLRRAFGFGDTTDYDPFLLFDDFRNDRPEDYLAGFPWHPHRGIETITYVLAGTVDHGDSLGNRGSLGAGDIQWMTAGSGILHQEMPKGDQAGRMHGFQLWSNLPASLKMTAPRYQDVQGKDVPEVVDDDGTTVRIVCGSFWGKTGPVEGVASDPRYLDIFVPPGVRKVTMSPSLAFSNARAIGEIQLMYPRGVSISSTPTMLTVRSSPLVSRTVTVAPKKTWSALSSSRRASGSTTCALSSR